VKRFLLCSALLALVWSSFDASSQVATGVPPFGSFGGGPFDVINLGNLNQHFTVPIRHKAGRGMPFSYDLTYDGSIWKPVGTSGNQTWQPTNASSSMSYWGWQGLSNSGTSYLSYSETYTQGTCGMQNNQTYYEWLFQNLVYYDTSGAHSFNGGGVYFISSACGGYGPQNGFQPALPEAPAGSGDGSGYTLYWTPTAPGGPGGTVTISAYITTKAGLTITPVVVSNPSGQQGSFVPPIDTNGNKITFLNGIYTDTLGQTALTVLGTAPSNTTLSYAAPSTGTATYTVSYAPYTVKTNFGCSGVTEYNQTNTYLVDRITLPDTTYYQFGYEPTAGGTSGQVTGRLASVTLPTGGSITYSYPLTSGGKNGINCTDGSAPAISGSPSLTRTVSPGGTWTYTRSFISGQGKHWQTKVTSPASDDTVIDFQQDGGGNNFYETQRQVYQSSQSGGTLLLTTGACYNGNTSSCTTTTMSSPISQTDLTLQYPGTNALQSLTETKYNSTYNLVADVKQYAYGAGAHGSVLRHTAITYASLGSIVDHPASVIVDDGTNTLSKTTYSYDESGYPVQTISGTPQHGTATGSRGNSTTITSYSTASATLSKHFQYYDTGMLYKSWDVNGSTSNYTTYTYDQTSQGNSTKSCGNSFPTKITSPPTPNAASGLPTSYAWNCYGAVATSVTDANGNSVTNTYSDPYFWRPASMQDPMQNPPTNFTYTAAASGSPASVESKMLFNSNSSITEQLKTLDPLGRVKYSQQQEGVGGSYDSIQITYDALGRPYQSTMPYLGSAGQSAGATPVTTTSYDPLGRVTQVQDGGTGYVSFSYSQNDALQINGPPPSGENLKQKQLEYDALGRLISVCEVTAGTVAAPAGACGQNTALPSPTTAYLTTYAYGTTTISSVVYSQTTVMQNAQSSPSGQQTRSYVYDLLGRLVQETNPETGNLTPGTTKYYFDTDAAGDCSGTYFGDLVKKVDNRGNKTCYTYDSLHRLSSVTYTSTSPDYAITPSKTFVYDAGTYSGTAMSNAMGRLAEAYTGSLGSKTTDEFFSYSKRGEMTDVYQSAPHSGTPYYHVTAGFWANGALNTLSSNISGIPSQTYSADGAGRPSSVTANSSQNATVVSSTTYDLLNYKTTVLFGSGDSDVFTLDSNTGRLKKYQFNVATKADIGSVTWNSNGSLGTLAISDTVPGTSDTQTCNYMHDDMVRVASANCGTAWNQTFSYDTFGNITKNATVGTTFLPGYSTATNQFTSLPGVTPTYDTDGRLTYDGTNHYTWDAESKMNTVNTTTALTYDAFGRLVEKGVSGSFTQIVYSPQGGKFAVMSGQTLQKGFVQLPTGLTAVYTPTGLAYYRHADHLGSSRLATTPAQGMYSSTAYAPFAEPYKQAGTSDLSFTGQDQDTVSGMHDFLDRRYMPVQGRWLTPDPVGLAAVDPASPQTWNRYAYVSNNPLALVDPFGDDACYDMSGGLMNAGSDYECALAGGQWVTFPNYVVDVNAPAVDPIYDASLVTVSVGAFAYIPGIGGSLGGSADNKSCPAVPAHPGYGNVNANMSAAKAAPFAIYSFYKLVRNHGPWDYKQAKNLNDFGQIINQSPFEDFGNFNFGATAASLGLPLSVALRGAGYAGVKAQPGSTSWDAIKAALGSSPYGDAPQDQSMIINGYNFSKQGCHE